MVKGGGRGASEFGLGEGLGWDCMVEGGRAPGWGPRSHGYEKGAVGGRLLRNMSADGLGSRKRGIKDGTQIQFGCV